MKRTLLFLALVPDSAATGDTGASIQIFISNPPGSAPLPGVRKKQEHFRRQDLFLEKIEEQRDFQDIFGQIRFVQGFLQGYPKAGRPLTGE